MQRPLVNVYLGGALGKRFGSKWQLAVSSPAEAMHAIDVNTKGEFRRYLWTTGKHRFYKIALQSKDKLIDPRTESRNRSGSSDIYILPTIAGANSGAGKIIAGVALLALLWWNPAGWFYAAATATSAGGLTIAGDVALSLGASLILGGISQLLAPHRKDDGELNSNNFQGSIAAGVQGGCVPVVYGTALVAPNPISIWFGAVDYNTTQNAYVGALQLANLPGGGYEYVSLSADANSGSTGGN